MPEVGSDEQEIHERIHERIHEEIHEEVPQQAHHEEIHEEIHEEVHEEIHEEVPPAPRGALIPVPPLDGLPGAAWEILLPRSSTPERSIVPARTPSPLEVVDPSGPRPVLVPESEPSPVEEIPPPSSGDRRPAGQSQPRGALGTPRPHWPLSDCAHGPREVPRQEGDRPGARDRR